LDIGCPSLFFQKYFSAENSPLATRAAVN
jgi:hypothetical protein